MHGCASWGVCFHVLKIGKRPFRGSGGPRGSGDPCKGCGAPPSLFCKGPRGPGALQVPKWPMIEFYNISKTVPPARLSNAVLKSRFCDGTLPSAESRNANKDHPETKKQKPQFESDPNACQPQFSLVNFGHMETTGIRSATCCLISNTGYWTTDRRSNVGRSHVSEIR